LVFPPHKNVKYIFKVGNEVFLNLKLNKIQPHYLIEITNDFIQQTQALQTLLVDICLVVELLVVGNGGEHHGHAGVALVVELRGAFQVQEMGGHVGWQDVLQQNLYIKELASNCFHAF